MVETAIVAFTTFFATIGPFDAAAVFIAITPAARSSQRKRLRQSAAAG
jgi:multiple antibiotic resistance protein